MSLTVTLTTPDAVEQLRQLHRREMNCQIIRDCWLARGFVDAYLLRHNDGVVGYGLVGSAPGEPRDAIVEFFILLLHRSLSLPLFRALVTASNARRIETQSNDTLLTLMLYDCATNITTDAILFSDALSTNLTLCDVTFRPIDKGDNNRIFAHTMEPIGDYVLEHHGDITATGGILFHYNPPFGDLYMEVAEPYRRRGHGSYLVQELKRVCSARGKVPAARCKASNHASRATLQKAGLLPCGRLLHGTLAD